MKIPNDKSKSVARRYNGIHRQQLFHWIGSHIDRGMRGDSARDRNRQREAYLGCLRSALSDGIWLKTPRKPDQLGDGSLVKVTRPIACFTEWSLGQSLPHTTEYGRLGFGFSKRFVLSRGGQPVIYIQDKKKGAPYSQALQEIARVLFDEESSVPPSVRERLLVHFDYICHFAKVMQRPPPKRAVTSKPAGFFPDTASALTGLESLEAQEVEKAFTRRYGRILHYLEEREWRIVHDVSLAKHFRVGPGGANQPEYLLPFESGNELFTVVMPDNLTINLALRDDEIRKRLLPDDAPHVTILSLEDIGTF